MPDLSEKFKNFLLFPEYTHSLYSDDELSDAFHACCGFSTDTDDAIGAVGTAVRVYLDPRSSFLQSQE